MPGLVPGIHADPLPPTLKVSCTGAAWMAGTSPAMTRKGCLDRKIPRISRTLQFPRTALREAGEGIAPAQLDLPPRRLFVSENMEL
jgi:hypothetical protein